MKILYLKCACGYNRLLTRQYKLDGYEVRPINSNPIWRAEAKSYGLKLPFTVVDGFASEA